MSNESSTMMYSEAAAASAARKGGAFVVALVNVADSPLADLADEVIELHAGAETSVAALEPLSNADDLYVLGRGLGFGVACEAALKFKEVCGLHAEGFSSAEVLHGPVTIARANFPVLVLAQNDQTLPGMRELVNQLAARDVKLITAGLSHPAAINLPAPGGHPVIEPVLRIQSFYRMANALSLRLGLNPDCPPYLQKVTSTV